MGMDEKMRNHVFTSREAALNYLKNNYNKEKFFHIGPPRDFDLFLSFKDNKCQNISDAEYILCTGLFDKHEKDLKF